MSNINDRFSGVNLSITGNAIRSAPQNNGVQGEPAPPQNRVGNFQTETGSRFIRQTAPTNRENIAQSVSNSRNRFQQTVNDRPLSFIQVPTENIRNLRALSNNSTQLAPLLQPNREPSIQQRTVRNSNIQQSPLRRLPSIINSSSSLQQQENTFSSSNRRTQGGYPIHVVTLGLEEPEGGAPARNLAPQILERRPARLGEEQPQAPSQELSAPPNNTTNISRPEEELIRRTAHPPSTSARSQPRFPHRLVPLPEATVSEPLNEPLEESLTPSQMGIKEEIENPLSFNAVPDLNADPLQRPRASNGRGERQNFVDRIRRDITSSNTIPLESEFSSLFSQEEALESPRFNTPPPIQSESTPSSPQISISSSEDTVQERPLSDQREMTPPGKTISPVNNGEDYFTDEEESFYPENYDISSSEHPNTIEHTIYESINELENKLQTAHETSTFLTSPEHSAVARAPLFLRNLASSIKNTQTQILFELLRLTSKNVPPGEALETILSEIYYPIRQAVELSLKTASHFLDTNLTLTPLEAHAIVLPAVESAMNSLHFFAALIKAPFEGLRAPGNNNQRDQQNDIISEEIITFNDLVQQISSAENFPLANLRDLFINLRDRINSFNNRFQGALN